METPCAGAVIALRGYDGKLLWQTKTYSEIFAMNCHGVDVNQDGLDDCIVSGRLKDLRAIDPKTGMKYLLKTQLKTMCYDINENSLLFSIT